MGRVWWGEEKERKIVEHQKIHKHRRRAQGVFGARTTEPREKIRYNDHAQSRWQQRKAAAKKRIQHFCTLKASQRIVKTFSFSSPSCAPYTESHEKPLFFHFDYSNNLHKQSTKLNDFLFSFSPDGYEWFNGGDGGGWWASKSWWKVMIKLQLKSIFPIEMIRECFLCASLLAVNCSSAPFVKRAPISSWHHLRNSFSVSFAISDIHKFTATISHTEQSERKNFVFEATLKASFAQLCLCTSKSYISSDVFTVHGENKKKSLSGCIGS